MCHVLCLQLENVMLEYIFHLRWKMKAGSLSAQPLLRTEMENYLESSSHIIHSELWIYILQPAWDSQSENSTPSWNLREKTYLKCKNKLQYYYWGEKIPLIITLQESTPFSAFLLQVQKIKFPLFNGAALWVQAKKMKEQEGLLAGSRKRACISQFGISGDGSRTHSPLWNCHLLHAHPRQQIQLCFGHQGLFFPFAPLLLAAFKPWGWTQDVGLWFHNYSTPSPRELPLSVWL